MKKRYIVQGRVNPIDEYKPLKAFSNINKATQSAKTMRKNQKTDVNLEYFKYRIWDKKAKSVIFEAE